MILIQNKEQQIVLSWKDIEGLKTKLQGFNVWYGTIADFWR